jgi:NAD(P)-dependent dehydrogenase (short-subunit alcohol dehydrogenase family)
MLNGFEETNWGWERNDMESLHGRVVIVSHADTDHGAALARVVCESGAAAVLTGSMFSDLGNLAKELHGETGAPIAIFAGDLSRDDERRSFAELVSELFPN